jgi:hypothetical protein
VDAMTSADSPVRACSRCVFFRPVRPLSQQLGAAVSSTDADVSQALGKMTEDEQKLREAEADYKRHQATTGSDHWPVRPVMSRYCGLLEDQDVYLIAEVKNAAHDCKNFSDVRPAPRRCEECRHQRLPEGVADDRRREEIYVDQMARDVSAGVAKDTSGGLLDAYRKGIASRQALEITNIYQTRGELFNAPKYLPHCARFSTEGGYVCCLTRNPHQTCPAWEPKEAPAMPHTELPLIAPPIALPVVGATDSGMLPTQQAHGPASTIAWLLDIELPSEIRALVERDLATWPELSALTALLSANGLTTPDVEDLLREQQQPAMILALRSRSDEASLAVVRLYDAANPPLAPGSPPLTAEVARAYLSLLSFVDALMEGRVWTPQQPELEQAFTSQLVAGYGTLTLEQQAWLATLPVEWARTRVLWAQASPPAREKLTGHLVDSLGATVQATPLLAEPAPSATPVLQSQPAAVAPESADVDPWASIDETSTTDEIMAAIIAEQKQREAQMLRADPQQAFQVKLQNQVANATMMSNMLNLRHTTAMSMINNIRYS